MTHRHLHHAAPATRGAAALLSVLLLAMLLASFALAGLSVTSRGLSGQSAHREQLASRYAAEAGLAQSIFALRAGGPAAQGSEDAPIEFGGASFWVASTPIVDDVLTVVAAGCQNHLETSIEATLEVGPGSTPRPAIFAIDGVELASNARVDSYDADAGTYEEQVENQEDGAYANSDATIASNGDIALSSNAVVYGNAAPGPDATVTTAGNSVVTGSTLPAEEPIVVDPIVVPEVASTGNFTIGGGDVVQLAAGQHAFDLLRLQSNSTLHLTGPATLVVHDFRIDSNAQFLIDTSAGPVEMYVASDFLIGSNTVMGPLNLQPGEFAINLLADNMSDPDVDIDLDETAFESNARIYGMINAPYAFIDIDSNFQLYGCLLARRVRLDSNARVHFDENLSGEEGGVNVVELVSWRIASRRVDMQQSNQ